MAVAVDGSMLGMRKEKGAPGQGECTTAGGLPGGVVGNNFAVRCRRGVPAYGVLRPDAGGRESVLKGDVVAEAEHCLRLRPDLEVVFIADGAPDNWSFCEEAFPARPRCWTVGTPCSI